ncbi:MAG: cell envelope-related transcriptional attenuator [Fusobacteria bacterium]|nr:MAG: cell envelope-related transcriptional attenuator [Fusobacteriota bacterium]KAF0228886.1 MAG: cell envelope-related transcriptional [Fusobacteriota bacterium]
MGRVDKFHKSKSTNNKRADNSSMEEILGKKALKVKKKTTDNDNMNIRKKKSKKKKGPLNRALVTLAILLVLVTGGYMTYQYFTTGSISNSISFAPRSVEFNDGEVTILILGTDGRDEVDGDRSDTIIVCRLNLKEGYARMISIPRDTRVKIPGKGTNKINAAYAFGGSELTKETIENFYNIEIDRIMEISFVSFTDAVDKLGGVDIVWEDEPLISKEWGVAINPGVNKLDSVTALSFVRFRDTPTADLGRIGRQQLFLKSLARDIKSKANFIQQLDIINSIYKGIETDLSLSEMMYIFNSYKEIDNFKMTTWMSAGNPEYVDGVSYVLPDINIKKLAQGFLDGELVVSIEDEGGIFPELITVEEKAIADQEEAKKVADENSK